MKGHLKAIIIVFIVLLLYTIVVFVYAKNKTDKNDNNTSTNTNSNQQKKPTEDPVAPKPEPVATVYDLNIVLAPKTFLGYKEGNWVENSSYDVSSKVFDFYTNNEKFQSKTLMYTDRWYVKNSDKTFLDYDNGFLAVNSSIDYSVIQYVDHPLSATNQADIEAFLQSNEIQYNYDNLYKEALDLDFNKDGLVDTVYVLSSVFLTDYTGFNQTFAYVFVKTLNQNIMLYRDSYNAVDAMSLCDPYIEGVIDADGKNTLIIGCQYSGEGGVKHILYNLSGKDAVRVLETEAN